MTELAQSVVPFDRDVGFAPTADNGLATRLTQSGHCVQQRTTACLVEVSH
jgi:hypothetical protein